MLGGRRERAHADESSGQESRLGPGRGKQGSSYLSLSGRHGLLSSEGFCCLIQIVSLPVPDKEVRHSQAPSSRRVKRR